MSAIAYDRRGDAAWLTIDRPEKRNALRVEDWYDLADALARAEAEARAAVIAGAGEAFCAGDDIGAIDDAETAADVEELGDCLHAVLFGIEELSVPAIAAVDGPAYGGGFELVAGCDLAVATERATFALPEVHIGAYPPYVVERVGATVGRKRLLELILTGDPIDADRAADWGVVNRVVSGDELEPTAERFVERIAAAPPRSVATARRAAARSVGDANERERVIGSLSQLRRDEACRAATRAFLED